MQNFAQKKENVKSFGPGNHYAQMFLLRLENNYLFPIQELV